MAPGEPFPGLWRLKLCKRPAAAAPSQLLLRAAGHALCGAWNAKPPPPPPPPPPPRCLSLPAARGQGSLRVLGAGFENGKQQVARNLFECWEQPCCQHSGVRGLLGAYARGGGGFPGSSSQAEPGGRRKVALEAGKGNGICLSPFA